VMPTRRPVVTRSACHFLPAVLATSIGDRRSKGLAAISTSGRASSSRSADRSRRPFGPRWCEKYPYTPSATMRNLSAGGRASTKLRAMVDLVAKRPASPSTWSTAVARPKSIGSCDDAGADSGHPDRMSSACAQPWASATAPCYPHNRCGLGVGRMLADGATNARAGARVVPLDQFGSRGRGPIPDFACCRQPYDNHWLTRQPMVVMVSA
jgi:hypothetical protein